MNSIEHGNIISSYSKAALFASIKHKHQKRKGADKVPYINHLIEVTDILINTGGVTEIDVIVTALLHDTVEDTNTTFEEIENIFGAKVAHYVSEVTDDKTLPQAKRKELQITHANSMSFEAKLVKLADKICNVREILENPPEGWSNERKVHYFFWSKAVVDNLGDVNKPMQKKFEEIFNLAINTVII